MNPVGLSLFIWIVLFQMPGFIICFANGRQLGSVLFQETILRVEAEILVVWIRARLVRIVSGDKPGVSGNEAGMFQARKELLDELHDLGLVGLHGHGEFGEPDLLAVAHAGAQFNRKFLACVLA